MLLSMMATTGEMWGQTRTEILNEPFNISGTDAVSSTYKGWAITRCWGGEGSIRLGASSGDKGQIISPALTSLSGDATMTFEVKRYGTDSGSIGISIAEGDGSVSGDISVASSSISADSWTTKTVSITGGSSTTKIKFLMSNKRMYLRNVVIVSSGGGTTPSISADDVLMGGLAQGTSILYEVDNHVDGGTMSATTEADWITELRDNPDQLEPGTGSIEVATTVNESASPRSATVTLTYTYNSKATVTKNVTVTQSGNPNAPGTENNPYTVAQARTAIDAGIGVTNVYATGIVSENVYYSEANHYITYNISSDGLTTSDQLQAFHGRNLDNTDFTSQDDIQVGDVVVIYGNLTKYNSTYEFADGNYLISLVRRPIITATPSPLVVPNYVVGTAEPEYETLTVNGSNLTANISLALNDNSNFEMSTDLTNWTSSLTLTQSEGSVTNADVAIRLKAGLAKGNYAGTVTLTSTNAEDVVVNLSGSVTGLSYTIESLASNGNITFDPVSPIEEGSVVTMTAVPADGYEFEAESWVFYNAQTLDIVVVPVTDGNKITMPAYNLAVDATFNAKQTYAITKVVTPDNSGTVETDIEAWEGKTVTVLVEAANGYAFSNIVISKTGEPETTIPTTGSAASGFTFTMPGYAVTATATFTETYTEGTFAKYTAEITEGYYVITYDQNALKNTISNNRFSNGEFSETDNIISNPDPSIVWYISPNGNYWTIYNDAIGKYAAGTNTKNQGALIESVTDLAKWTVTVSNGVYQFENLGRSNAISDSGNKWLRNNGNNGWACYASSTGGALTLFKMTNLTERTITFNGNGGTYIDATTYTQTVYDGVSTALTANQFTKANSEFAGWALTADGDVEYADQAAVTINADLELYAKWLPLYTLTIDNNIEGGSVSIDGSITSAVEGTEITLSYSPTTGHAFSAWNVYKTGDTETIITVTDNKFNMPAYNVTVSATFVEATTYSLVTDASQIVSGKHYIIASGKEGTVKAMSVQNDNNRGSVSVTVNNNIIAETQGVYEFVINGPVVVGENQCYTIYDKNENSTGFLYAASSNNNHLKTQSTLNDNGKWTIEVAVNGVATIKAKGNNSRNTMQNNGNLFSCYASASQSPVYLYVKYNDNDLEFYGNNTCNDYTIPATETVTIASGSTLTVTGTLTNEGDASNLIIEDGGQLIHNGNVTATLKKNVAGYNTRSVSGWYTIASPVANMDVNCATTGTYDFFAFNEENTKWLNQKVAANNITNFEQGVGYLYANADATVVNYLGTLIGTETEVTKALSYDCENNSYKGFNLMGNPFSRNLVAGDIEIDGTPVTTYYTVEGGNELATKTLATTPIKPGQGFMVQATASSQNLVFNPSSKDRDAAKVGYITIVAGNNENTDNAFVQVGGGNTLRKMTLSDNSSVVYVMSDGKDYAAANIDALEGSMPICFKANTLGTYTITIETNDVDAEYLHLIDNFTGDDINLLLEPSYSFIANNGDKAERFTLVFRANGNEGTTNNLFAYQNNNDIIVNGEGELQVFDVTGRMVATQHVNGVQTVNVPSQGVFIFKLNEKTQKIVVR